MAVIEVINNKSWGKIYFADENTRNEYMCLTESCKIEFMEDLSIMLEIYRDMPSPIGGHHNIIGQRLGDKYYKVEIFVDIKESEEEYVLINKFKPTSINDYLDHLNYIKTYEDKNYIDVQKKYMEILNKRK